MGNIPGFSKTERTLDTPSVPKHWNPNHWEQDIAVTICKKCGNSTNVIDLSNPNCHTTDSDSKKTPITKPMGLCKKCGNSFTVIDLSNPCDHKW